MTTAQTREASTTTVVIGEDGHGTPAVPPQVIALEPRAKVIANDASAIAAAEQVAAVVAPGAADRDRDRRLPYEEIRELAASGLLGITVPKAAGGAGVSTTTLGRVMQILAAADSNIAQIPKNHFLALDILSLNGSADQKRFMFDEVLNGRLIGHAASERGTKNVLEIKTRLAGNGTGPKLTGKKFYTTGSLYADWIAASAIDDSGRYVTCFVPRHAEGVTVIDDWSGFGQRTTASGTTIFDGVVVDPTLVLSLEDAYVKPTLAGPVSQYLHACIDLGIAGAAIDETMSFVNTRARPWADSGVDRACEDPYIISAIGDLRIRLFAADAVVEKVGLKLDHAAALPTTEDAVAAASIDVAIAKVLTTELAILATNKLFELSGAGATLASDNLDRYWRNARTHTLHDPVRWKYNAVGDFFLNCVNPRRHNYI